MWSHVPRLFFLANNLNLNPITDAEKRANAAIVVRMFEELALHWTLLVRLVCTKALLPQTPHLHKR